MSNENIYRCNLHCPIHKQCFILKSKDPIDVPIIVLHKCPANKKDIEVVIGQQHTSKAYRRKESIYE